MRTIKVMGVDPSLRNWGMAIANVDVVSGEIDIVNLILIETEKEKSKQVRKSSDDLRRANELHAVYSETIKAHDVRLVMSEIPHGAQSARASWGLGIALGILASTPVPVIQVSALNVKNLAVGDKTASKVEMIAWAATRWPKANWLRHSGFKLLNKNEHLADAVGAVNAGIQTDQYKQATAMMLAMRASA